MLPGLGRLFGRPASLGGWLLITKFHSPKMLVCREQGVNSNSATALAELRGEVQEEIRQSVCGYSKG